MQPGSQNPDYIVNGDMSATITGPWLDITYFQGFSIEALWTGATAAGTIKLQASNGLAGSNPDIPGSAQPVAGPGSYLWNLDGQNYKKVRLVFTPTSGTGVLNANMFAKEAGA